MMAEPVTRLAQLRAGTRDAHAHIETVPALARLLNNDLTRNEYITILQYMHAFHACVEPAIAAELETIPAAAAMLDGSRPRALADDLAWFEARPVSPPYMTVPSGPVAALGALYVIEGSSMGARVIARHVTNSIGVSAGAGGSFYCHQDADTARRRWHCLSALLETPVFDGERPGIGTAVGDRMVAGAQETFRSLERWMRMIEIAPGHSGAPIMAVAP